MKFLALTLVTLALAGPAFADDANTYSCQKPVVPNSQSSEMVIKLFNKRLVTYKACIDKFVEDRRAFVKENETKNPADAKAAYDAAEKAQKEYNDVVAELNANTAPPDDKK